MENSHLSYYVWYHKLFGKTLKGKKALSFYGSYKAFYEAITSGNDETGILRSAPLGKYTSFSLVDAEKVIDTCEKNGWEIITSDSEFYPSELLEISDYPHILFVDGKKEVLTRNVKFAIVGSREAKPEAEIIAHNAAYNLASTGAVIVSGAAVGIDSAAHLGAVRSGGETIGVLGCGLGNEYMKRISAFYDEMKQSGVYITELFPFEHSTRASFPDRNRIISGLSRGVLVACAAEGSGSLNTASHAKKQKRSIFVPAPEVCFSEGCNSLLSDGAYVLYNAGDMAYPNMKFYKEGSFNPVYCNKPISIGANDTKYEDMALPKRGKSSSDVKSSVNSAEKASVNKSADKRSTPPAVKKEDKKNEFMSLLSENALKIYDIIDEKTIHPDELVNLTSMNAVSVQIAISELETFGFIKCLPGGYVCKS